MALLPLPSNKKFSITLHNILPTCNTLAALVFPSKHLHQSSATKKVPVKFYILNLLPTYGSIHSSLVSLL